MARPRPEPDIVNDAAPEMFPAPYCDGLKKGRSLAPFLKFGSSRSYFSALSVISCVKAPSGSLLMTGSEPPLSSVATVRL